MRIFDDPKLAHVWMDGGPARHTILTGFRTNGLSTEPLRFEGREDVPELHTEYYGHHITFVLNADRNSIVSIQVDALPFTGEQVMHAWAYLIRVLQPAN
jgi:hypothetical protein